MKSIRFKTEEVQSVLEGRKTVTRMFIKDLKNIEERTKGDMKWEMPGHWYPDDRSLIRLRAPYQVGDVLWVRETWKDYFNSETDDLDYCYRADEGKEGVTYIDTDDEPIKWRPSIHMPKEAARIFLKVTDVRVERLQDIKEEQAEKEGCAKIPYKPAAGKFGDDDIEEDEISARELYSELWDFSIKTKELEKFGWDANPWVFVYEFKMISESEAKND